MPDEQSVARRLCDISVGLSSWEMEFIETLADMAEKGVAWTDRQHAKAQEILERYD